jgi:flagellar hook assembly protein FlgD
MIHYQLFKGGRVSLEIFNQLGQKISNIYSGKQTAGTYRISWDGKNTYGVAAASGIYYMRLTVDNIARTRKLILEK